MRLPESRLLPEETGCVCFPEDATYCDVAERLVDAFSEKLKERAELSRVKLPRASFRSKDLLASGSVAVKPPSLKRTDTEFARGARPLSLIPHYVSKPPSQR